MATRLQLALQLAAARSELLITAGYASEKARALHAQGVDFRAIEALEVIGRESKAAADRITIEGEVPTA